MQTGSAANIARQVGELLVDKAVDPREPSRMWLVTGDAATGRRVLSEVHPISRLLFSTSGLAFLTPPGRDLLGIAFYLVDLRLPSPDEVERRCAQELAVPGLPISQRWRWQRIARQLPRARERRAKWAEFAFDNSLGLRERELVGVVLPGERSLWDVASDQPVPAAAQERFWLENPYSRIAAAVQNGR